MEHWVRRWYRNCEAIQLKTDPKNDFEFQKEYIAAVEKQVATRRALDGPVINYVTVEDLYNKWKASPEWKQYAEGTKIQKNSHMKEAMKVRLPGEPLKFGDQNYTLLRKRNIYQLRQYKYEEGATETKDGAPGAANNWAKDLSALFTWAIRQDIVPDQFVHPCRDIEKLKEGPGHHTWTDEELRQFEDYWPLGSRQRLAFAVTHNTCARISDAYRLGRAHEGLFDGREYLTWKPFKGQDEFEEAEDDDALEVSVPVHPKLREAVDCCPSGNLVYCFTELGIPFKSAKGFENFLSKAIAKAGLSKNCVPHGLRKAGAKMLAEAGATEYQLMSVMGWSNPAQAMKYIEAARRRKMATGAYDRLETEQNKDKEKQKVTVRAAKKS